MFGMTQEPAHAGVERISALLEDWMPPSRGNWEIILFVFQWIYPAVASAQWVTKWYGMGKTSVTNSRLNIPGRIAWMTMELPGPFTLLYTMRTLPARQGIDDLPWQNKVLAGLFVIHYAYRAVAYPLMAVSMSPVHLFVWAGAVVFQLLNASSLGGWLAAYGPVTESAWGDGRVGVLQFVVGIAIFYIGLAANFFHDEELREIRRREQRRQDAIRQQGGGKVDKHYRIPTAGLFRYVLYPHYLCEWIEWTGLWVAAGWGCAPARAFVVTEVAVMLPRAVRGRRWYMERFGEEKIRRKYAVIPGLI